MNLTEENVAPYAGSEQRIEEVSQKFDLRESVYGRRESLLLRGVMGHARVDAALAQLAQHLLDALVAGSGQLCLCDPTDAVIAPAVRAGSVSNRPTRPQRKTTGRRRTEAFAQRP